MNESKELSLDNRVILLITLKGHFSKPTGTMLAYEKKKNVYKIMKVNALKMVKIIFCCEFPWN